MQCRPPTKAAASLALLTRPQVSAWIERELQALLLDGDVSIIVQHILGSLQGAFLPPGKRCVLSTNILAPVITSYRASN